MCIRDSNDNDKVTKDPGDPENRDSRVLRGPSLGNEPGGLRSAVRNWLKPSVANGFIGFRCARGSPRAP